MTRVMSASLLRGFVLAAACASLGSACDLSRSCTLIGCFNSARARVNLLPRQGTLPDSRLTACRSTVCATAPFPASPAPGEIHSFSFSDLSVTGSLHLDADGTRRLEVEWRLDPTGRPPDGDRYSVKLMDSEGTTVLSERTVTYRKHTPNGEDCGPTCWMGEVTP